MREAAAAVRVSDKAMAARASRETWSAAIEPLGILHIEIETCKRFLSLES